MKFISSNLRPSLHEHLVNAILSGIDLKKANSQAARLTGTSHVRFYWESFLTSALKTWLAPLCEAISKDCAGETGNTLKVSDLPTRFQVLPQGLSLDSQTIVEANEAVPLVDAILSTYPIDSLTQCLNTNSQSLETEGFEIIASRVIDKLGLQEYNNGNHFFKATKRHFCFDRGLSDYSYGQYGYRIREKYHQLLNDLRFIENEVGNVGIANAFAILNESIQAGQHVGGQTFGNVNTCQIKGFNHHIRICMVPETIEALYCFLVSHKQADVVLKALPK